MGAHSESYGDLWPVVEQHLQAKRLHSVVARWVKAHTGDKEVAECIITKADQIGNAEADCLASKGGNAAHKGLYQLSSLYAIKHKLYRLLIFQIHEHILRVLAFDRDARERQAKKGWATGDSESSGSISPVMLKHFELSARTRDVRQIHPTMVDKDNAEVQAQRWAFLHRLKLAPLEPVELGQVKPQGTSWLEL